jgi:hypothetical protein
MNGAPRARGYLWMVVVLIVAASLHPGRAWSDATASTPQAMRECENNRCGSDMLGIWTFKGDRGLATWPNGGAAELHVERFDDDSVVIQRSDLPGSIGSGIVARYVGKRHGDQIDGAMTWNSPGAPMTTWTWHAQLGNPAEQQSWLRDQTLALRSGLFTSVDIRNTTAYDATKAQPPAGAATAATSLDAAPALADVQRIFVLSGGNGMNTTSVSTYTANGQRIAPTIGLGNNNSIAMVGTANGKLYISHNAPMDSLIATYQSDGALDPGARKIPANVRALALGPSGTIYSLETATTKDRRAEGVVRIYDANGNGVGAAIHTNIENATSLAVGPAGQIYVASMYDNAVLTFDSNGQRISPTLKDGIDQPMGVAVDSHGKIYVVSEQNVTVVTYLPDGQRTTPTFRLSDLPSAVTTDREGRIYIGYGRELGIYTADGRTIETIANVAVDIRGVAVQLGAAPATVKVADSHAAPAAVAGQPGNTVAAAPAPADPSADSQEHDEVLDLTGIWQGDIGAAGHPTIITLQLKQQGREVTVIHLDGYMSPRGGVLFQGHYAALHLRANPPAADEVATAGIAVHDPDHIEWLWTHQKFARVSDPIADNPRCLLSNPFNVTSTGAVKRGFALNKAGDYSPALC